MTGEEGWDHSIPVHFGPCGTIICHHDSGCNASRVVGHFAQTPLFFFGDEALRQVTTVW